MRRQNIPAVIAIGVLALSVVPALAQSARYPSDRRVDDNGSVNEPGPGGSAAAGPQMRMQEPLQNSARTMPQQQRYYPSSRRADDNGSVNEPGPGR